MIDLALLCNLYADGPTTLGRLREMGCEQLLDVEELADQDLAWVLQADASTCARFRREARLLRQRRGALASDAAGRAGQRGEAADGARSEPAPDGSRREGGLLGRLMTAWRRASGRTEPGPRPQAPRPAEGPPDGGRAEGAARTSAAAPAPAAVPTPTPTPAPALRGEPRVGAEPAVELPPQPRRDPGRPPAAASTPSAGSPLAGSSPAGSSPAGLPPFPARPGAERGTPLAQVGFEGVEAEYADQLARLGLGTVEQFLAAQPLDLAGRSSMRYTVLLRMQFVARRALERSV